LRFSFGEVVATATARGEIFIFDFAAIHDGATAEDAIR
jgi:hypothetical protein